MDHAEWLRSEATKAESWGEHGRAERQRAIADCFERLERVRELASKLADTSDQPKRSSFMRGRSAGTEYASKEILALLDTPEAEPEEPAKPEPHDGWITHDGEPLTFADDVWLEAELRDGKRVAALASNVSWMHHGELDDVVRYRALPNLFEEPPGAGVTREEPTLRDRFAMAALTGLLPEVIVQGHENMLAGFAYSLADAMLAARLRRDEG